MLSFIEKRLLKFRQEIDDPVSDCLTVETLLAEVASLRKKLTTLQTSHDAGIAYVKSMIAAGRLAAAEEALDAFALPGEIVGIPKAGPRSSVLFSKDIP